MFVTVIQKYSFSFQLLKVLGHMCKFYMNWNCNEMSPFSRPVISDLYITCIYLNDLTSIAKGRFYM